MSTLTVTLSDEQANRYGLQQAESVSMNTLIDKIKDEMAKDALRRCWTIAAETNLSAITTADIDAEIRAVRMANRA